MVEGYKKSEIGVVPKEWDVKPFGDVFKILSNNTLSRDCLNYHSGSIKNIHYGDVLILFPEVLDCTRDDIPYINSDVLLTGMSLNEGDIIISDTAEDETVGKATEIYNKGDINVVSGLHTIPCRTIERKYTSGWWGYYINSKCFHDQLLPYIHGTKVSSIARDSLFKTFVVVPPIEEQKRIVKALRDIDRLIEQSEQLVNKYKLIKEGCLHVLFPNGENKKPEIRIAGFDDDWEQRKVTELGEIYIGLVTTMTSHYADHGALLIRNSDIKDSHFEFDNNPIYLDDEFAKQNASRKHKIGDVITVHTGDIGTSAVITEKEAGSIGFATIVTRPNRGLITSEYLCSYLNTDTHKNFAMNISTGDGRNNYNLKDYYECVVPVPSIAEQMKISNFIDGLNNLITLHQRKVEKYKMIKQGMIEDLMTGKVRLI